MHCCTNLEDLEQYVFKKGNVMMMMEIQSKADAVKQKRRPVEQYVSELQCLMERDLRRDLGLEMQVIEALAA